MISFSKFVIEKLSKAAQEKKYLHKVQDYDTYGQQDRPDAKAARKKLRQLSGTGRKFHQEPREHLDEDGHDCKNCDCSTCGGSCKVKGKPCPKCHG